MKFCSLFRFAICLSIAAIDINSISAIRLSSRADAYTKQSTERSGKNARGRRRYFNVCRRGRNAVGPELSTLSVKQEKKAAKLVAEGEKRWKQISLPTPVCVTKYPHFSNIPRSNWVAALGDGNLNHQLAGGDPEFRRHYISKLARFMPMQARFIYSSRQDPNFFHTLYILSQVCRGFNAVAKQTLVLGQAARKAAEGVEIKQLKNDWEERKKIVERLYDDVASDHERLDEDLLANQLEKVDRIKAQAELLGVELEDFQRIRNLAERGGLSERQD